MTGDGWPYPGDGPLARARRVAHAYRARLLVADSEACAGLDTLMRRWGQSWAVPSAASHDLDDWVPPSDAAEIAAVGEATLRQWRLRRRIAGRRGRGPDGRLRWEYRVGDLLALSTSTRTRRRDDDD